MASSARALSVTSLALFLHLAGPPAHAGAPPAIDPPLAPLHVTIVSHAEEDAAYLDRTVYLRSRGLVKKLAEAITRRGAAFDFQSDWTFLAAAARYEAKGSTNIVRWLAAQPGIQVDPHAHEHQYNYADVASLIEDLGVAPSKVVGGFLYDPPDNPQGWEQHEAGIQGWRFPGYFWRADVLWGAATFQHQGPDDHGSGLWQPRDRWSFGVHDPAQRLVYVGTCGGASGQEQAIRDLLAAISTGQAPATGFYTASITVGQGRLTEQEIASLAAFIDEMQPHVLAGRLRWVTLSESVELWRAAGTGPFRYDCDTGTVTIP